jgi:hypothetical protein
VDVVLPGGFVLAFPVYLLARRDGTAGFAFVVLPHPAGLVPVFTAADLARRAAGELRLPGAAPVPVPAARHLAAVLRRYRSAGLAHVGLDLYTGAGPAVGRLVAIGDLIDALTGD